MANTKISPKRDFNYDLIKAFAIITMVIDHIGAFLIPDQVDLRIVGRAAAPIFCFLIAYSNSKKTDGNLLALGTAIVVLDYILHADYKANILITLFFLRYLNSILDNKDLKLTPYSALPFTVLCLILFPALLPLEYSTSALVAYLFGHIVRTNNPNKIFFMFWLGSLYFIFTYAFFGLMAFPLFTYIYILMTFLLLTTLKSKPYGHEIGLIQYSTYFLGKYALQIYFIHLALFKIISFYMG